MLNLWLELKILFDYIIPLSLFGIIFLLFIIFLIHTFIQSIIWDKKIKLLQKNEYKRYLIDVPSYGNGAWYGWQKDNYKYKISEKELEKISYSTLKKELKL